MAEEVCVTLVWLDEAEALLRVPPQHLTGAGASTAAAAATAIAAAAAARRWTAAAAAAPASASTATAPITAASAATATSTSTTALCHTIDGMILALAVVELDLVPDLVARLHAPIAIKQSICMAEDVLPSIILPDESKALL